MQASSTEVLCSKLPLKYYPPTVLTSFYAVFQQIVSIVKWCKSSAIRNNILHETFVLTDKSDDPFLLFTILAKRLQQRNKSSTSELRLFRFRK